MGTVGGGEGCCADEGRADPAEAAPAAPSDHAAEAPGSSQTGVRTVSRGNGEYLVTVAPTVRSDDAIFVFGSPPGYGECRYLVLISVMTVGICSYR